MFTIQVLSGFGAVLAAGGLLWVGQTAEDIFTRRSRARRLARSES